MTSAVEPAQLSPHVQAFVDVLNEAMTVTASSQESEQDDDRPRSGLVLIPLQPDQTTVQFIYYIGPADPDHPRDENRVIALPHQASDDDAADNMTQAERYALMHFLGSKPSRTEALGLAAMFSDDEEKVKMMPTMAALLGQQPNAS